MQGFHYLFALYDFISVVTNYFTRLNCKTIKLFSVSFFVFINLFITYMQIEIFYIKLTQPPYNIGIV